jgi:hypothetical protein
MAFKFGKGLSKLNVSKRVHILKICRGALLSLHPTDRIYEKKLPYSADDGVGRDGGAIY